MESGVVLAGRYRIDRRLGAGGVGVVYLATHLELRRPVAVKCLHGRPEGHGELNRERFRREARVAASLRHPNAVEIFDFGEDDDRLYLVMAYLEGRTLSAALAEHEGGLPLERALPIGAQVADVLVAAHDMGLVHRDLKPDNVFLERPLAHEPEAAERVVVVDFGLAFIADDEELGRMTQTGDMVGTPAYVSPEQARGGNVGPPSDVYSLGCMLYELACGQRPFEGSAMSIVVRHMCEVPEPLRRRRPAADFPAALDALIARMLAKEPAARPDAAEVKAALEDPALLGAGRREREDAAGLLLGRAVRMVPAVAPGRAVGGGDDWAHLVAIRGEVPDALLLALAANGLQPVSCGDAPPPAISGALYAPGVSPEEVPALLAHGIPLLTDVDPESMERMAALLRAGVTDVVTRPVDAAGLPRKLRRAIRRARSRKKGA